MSLASRLLVVLLLSLATGQSVWAQKRPSERSLQAAREFVEISGFIKDFEQLLPQVAAVLAQSYIELAPDRADEIREIMAESIKRSVARRGELAEVIAGVYAANLSYEDLRELTKFYRSPAGRRLVRAQPKIARQSMAAGEKLGESIRAEIDAEMRRELKKRGLDM